MDLKTLIVGYEEWISRFLNDDWQVYYITFQFNHLSFNQNGALEAMKKEIERFYTTPLIHHIPNNDASEAFRFPKSLSSKGTLKQWQEHVAKPSLYSRACTVALAMAFAATLVHIH
jgi:hypothetical protein